MREQLIRKREKDNLSCRVMTAVKLTLICSGIIEEIENWHQDIQNITTLQHKEEEFLKERDEKLLHTVSGLWSVQVGVSDLKSEADAFIKLGPQRGKTHVKWLLQCKCNATCKMEANGFWLHV